MTPTGLEHNERNRLAHGTIVGLILAGLVAPLVVYGILFGQVATLTPDEARNLLQDGSQSALLVDVRQPEAFEAGHIDGTVNWPIKEILTLQRADQLPAEFRDKRLLLLCDVGLDSCRATWHLDKAGVEGVVNVRGGIQEWIHCVAKREGELYDRWQISTNGPVEFPFRESSRTQQVISVLAFFIIKPIYTMLALAVIIVLWKSRSPDLVALRWAMIFFFLGENSCAVSFLAFKERSYLFEYLHGYGMLLCFGFTAYAFLEAVDHRLLMLSTPERRCASLNFCTACIKQGEAPCRLKQTFYLIIPAFIVLTFMLLTADWQDNVYNTIVFDQFYNYGHLRVHQLFESWYCGGAAILLFSISLYLLIVRGRRSIGPAKIAFSAGLGPLGFGTLRMILGAAYDENRVWYLFWEEGTEFLFILGICFTLWTFRHGLFPKWNDLPGFFRTLHDGWVELKSRQL